MTQIIELTKKLISIPSYVDGDINEATLGQYIYKWLDQNTTLTLEKQFLPNSNRFNIFAKNSSQIDLFLVGHIDTVPPSQGWTKDPFNPTIIGGKLYGLGSSDMKGGLASIMLQSQNNLPPNTGILFYTDEEYDFAGILEFIKKYPNLRPKKIVSLDGSNLQIQNACRGVIEITFTVTGISGHAAKANSGSVNAIDISFQAILNLRNILTKYSSPLGPSSLNLASIDGGLQKGSDQIYKQSGNMVADICQFTLDIRPSTPKLDTNIIISNIKNTIKKLGGKLVNTKTRFDFGCWYTNPALIKSKLSLIDASKLGYMDIQILWQQYQKPVCICIGAADIKMAHKPNEYISIAKLNRLPKILNNLINNKC